MKSPKEFSEQRRLVKYLTSLKLRFSALPLDTWTGSFSIMAKNRAGGVRKGVPDIVVVIEPWQSKNFEGALLFIEMKRVTGGRLSPEQKEWIDSLNLVSNVYARCCKGFVEAKCFVDEFFAAV